MQSHIFDWASYSAACHDDAVASFAEARGFHHRFVRAVRDDGFLGCCPTGQYASWMAFPLHDTEGVIVGAQLAHPRKKQFVYEPPGIAVGPWVIGQLAEAQTIHVFESQYDLLAVMDRLDTYPRRVPDSVAFASTRGAANVRFLENLLPIGATVVAWVQSDDEGERWSRDLEHLCARERVRFSVIRPPGGYKDFNDAVRADPDRSVYSRETLERLVADTTEGATSPVKTPSADGERCAEEETEPRLEPFPLDALPPAGRAIAEAAVEVLRLPDALVGVVALGVLSAALGGGIAVVSGPERKAYGNLYLLAAAASGSGKSEVARLIYEPIITVENELMETFEKETRPRALARKKTLERDIRSLAGSSRSARDDDNEMGDAEEELAQLEYELSEVEKRLVAPALRVEDVTTEALAVRLAGRGYVSCFSPDARDVVNTILGRYRDKGQTDEGLYIKMWSGDPHQVDRIARPPIRLDNARLSGLWLVQPDKFRELTASESLSEGGFLPRMLLTETGAEMQMMDPENTATVSPEVKSAWSVLVRSLLERYRLAERERELVVCPTPETRHLIAAFHNDAVVTMRRGMRDVESYFARWAEQAWRIALILHVAEHPEDAETHPLTGETTAAALAITRWFCSQQHRSFTQGREEKKQKRLDRLVRVLQLQGGEETVRNLRDRYGFKQWDIDSLIEAFPKLLCMEERPAGPRGGRPSRWVKAL